MAEERKRFSITKEYRYTKNYKIVKKSFIDKILEEFRPKQKKQQQLKEVKEKVEVKGLDVTLMRALPFLILIGLIAFSAYFYFQITSSLAEQQALTQEIGKTPELKGSYFIDYGSRDNRISAALFSIYLPEDKIYSVKISFLKKPFSGVVYIYSDDIYPKTLNTLDFMDKLKKNLKAKGFIVQNIYSKEQLFYMDKNSIFVLPSDKIPPNMEFYFDDMLRKGIVPLIITTTPEDEVFSGGIKKIDSYWAAKNVNFKQATFKPSNMKMLSAYFIVSNAQIINDGASYVFSDKGEFIFVPGSVGDNLYIHWANTDDAALDISNVIEEYVKGLRYFKNEGQKLVPVENVFNLNNGSHYVYLENTDKNVNLNALLTIEAENTLPYYIIGSVQKDYNGYIYFSEPMPILPFYVRKNPVIAEVVADLNSSNFAKVEVEILNANLEVIDKLPVFSGQPFPLNNILQIQYSNESLRDQRYVIQLVNSNTREVYARSLIELGDLQVRAEPQFDKGIITIYFEIAGKPTKIGQAVISSTSFGDYQAIVKNSDRAVLDLSKYFGGSIPAGNYTFKVDIQGLGTREVNVYRAPALGITRLFSIERIIMFLIAGIIYAAGFLIKRNEELPYSIDVPDFAPVEYNTLQLTEEEILKSFDTISDYYKWKYIPLKLEEIKRGISMYLGRTDLIINDFNLEIVLATLEREGLIEEESGFYIKKEWLKTGFTKEQLVAFRLIRDAAISNAVQFKNLTRSLPNTKLMFPWQEFWIYLYSSVDKERIVETVIQNVYKNPDALHVIVVHDQEEAYTFHTLLSTGRKKDALLKAYIDNGIVFMFTTQELVDKINQLNPS